MTNITFEKEGLTIGLIAHPFFIDHKKLFFHEFKRDLFGKYKENVAHSFGSNKANEYLKSSLYQPKCYCLFGNYNMAILSLIDGYAFSNRVFHPGHGNRQDKVPTQYHYQLLTGSSTLSKEEQPYLQTKAEETFLLRQTLEKTEILSYPFIGITRLKINNGLLIGSGMELVHAVRILTDQLLQKEKHINAFTIDSFGSHEIILVTFSNSFMKLYRFIAKIKCCQIGELEKETGIPILPNSLISDLKENNPQSFHVFSNAYTHLGYDMEWSEDKNNQFLPLEEDEKLQILSRWTFKPGHEQQWDIFLKENNPIVDQFLKSNPLHFPSVNSMNFLEGVNTNYIQVPFNFSDYYQFTQLLRKSGLKKHLQNFRTHLYYVNNETAKKAFYPESRITETLSCLSFHTKSLSKLREDLLQCGVSKLTRERLLKMFARYNDYVQDQETYVYFIELRDFLEGIIKAVSHYVESSELPEEIDNYLNEAISIFEQAFFNRFHQGGGTLHDITLEYNGGIQQYVTSFDLIFKESIKNLTDEDNTGELSNRSFVFISGYENVVSFREGMRINMNLITYPELFAVSIYKEAGNFMRERTTANLAQTKGDIKTRLTHQWDENIFQKKLPNNLQKLIRQSDIKYLSAPTHLYLADSINAELIEYFVADIQNLYFGFNSDFKLLYYFYWKYFLQIASFYKRNGEPHALYFITFLLRLFILQFYIYQDKEKPAEIIANNYEKSPFDPRLKNLWQAYFPSVLEIAEIIWDGLKSEGFIEYINHGLIHRIERQIGKEYLAFEKYKSFDPTINYPEWDLINKFAPDILKEKVKQQTNSISDIYRHMQEDAFALQEFYFQIRKLHIQQMEEKFRKHQLITPEKTLYASATFVTDMLIAYLNVIYKIDHSNAYDKPFKCLIRNEQGNPYNSDQPDNLNDFFSPLLSDPHGGIFTHGLEERQTYFAYRTTLYKSLWDYAMRIKKQIIQKQISNDKQKCVI